jgi:hypothetical protein
VNEDDFDDDDDAVSLYVIPARAPVAAVFCRAPEEWWMIARWDLASGELEHGAWLRGTLFPRRSDLSPEGAILSYFLAKDSKRPFMGMHGRQTFSAVCKLPWVFALAAWREESEDVPGYHFTERGVWEIGEPQHGDAAPLQAVHGMRKNDARPYGIERRRGWTGDDVVLTKPRPLGSAAKLVLEDRGYDPDMPGAFDGRAPEYRLQMGGKEILLDDAAWADWDGEGRLLVATEDARLQIRRPDPARVIVIREHDLGALSPRPGPAPDWAQRW